MFENIQAVVESINHVMSDIVRMTIFVKDMRDAAAVEEVYAAFLPIIIQLKQWSPSQICR